MKQINYYLMKKLFLIIFLFNPAILINIAFAQPLTWQKLYDTPDHVNNYSYDACDALNGNYFISGFTYIGKINLYKINKYGDVIWNRLIDGLQSQTRSIVSSGDGGCIMVGLGSQSTKIDSNGSVVWNKIYNDNPQLWDIEKTSDGGYISCGTVNNYTQWYIIKIDSNGDFQWDRTGLLSSYIVLYSCTETTDNGYLFYGTYSDANLNGSGIALKVNNQGNTIWQRNYTVTTYGSTFGNSCTKISNYYLFSGYAADTAHIGYSYLIKTNINGDTINTLKYYYPYDQGGPVNDCKVINFNRIAIASTINTTQSGFYSRILIIDSNGAIIHQKDFQSIPGHNSFLELRSIVPLPDGGILSSGYADYFDNNNVDAFVIKTDSALNAPPPIGIIKINTEIPKEFVLYPNYPNPFNSSTVFSFSLSKQGLTELLIYDINGKLIESLFGEKLNPGNYKLNWNANNFASGIYFLEIKFERTYIKTQKILLIK